MNDILSIGVAKTLKRNLIVDTIEQKTVQTNDSRTTQKIVLHTKEVGTDREFTISDSWIEDYKGQKRVAGLWVNLQNNEINVNSTLARLLNYYNVKTIGDLIGKEVIAYPDRRDYLVLTACDME